MTSVFVDEYCGYHDVGRFEDAMAFIELALFIDKNDKELQALKELVPLVALDATIGRLDCDCYLIPYLKSWRSNIFMKALTSNWKKALVRIIIKQLQNIRIVMKRLPGELCRSKKDIPLLLIKRFKATGKPYFAEHTAGLNRRGQAAPEIGIYV